MVGSFSEEGCRGQVMERRDYFGVRMLNSDNEGMELFKSQEADIS